MPLKQADRLEHQNPTKALMDINFLEGAGCVVDKIGRSSIGIDKRKAFFACQVGLDRHVYMSADLSNAAWENDVNWRVDSDFFIAKDLSNMTAQQIADFKAGLAIDTDDVAGLEALIMTGIKLVEPVIDIVATLPTTGRVEGDRYIDTTYNEIFTFIDGFFHTEGTPTEGTTVWVIDNNIAPANDKGWYRFNGTSWIYIGKPYKHSELIDKLGNGEYHMSLAEWTAMTGGMNSDADAYHTHSGLAKKDGSNISKYEFNNNLYTLVSTTQTFYINTDAVINGDGSVSNPWNSFSGFAEWIKDKKLNPTSSGVIISINVDGVNPLKITDADQMKIQNATYADKGFGTLNMIDVTGLFTQLSAVTSVVRDVTYPSKYYVTSVDFNSTANFYRYKFVKSGTDYYPISASGSDAGGNYIITTALAGTPLALINSTLLDVATFAAGGIFEPKTEIRGTKTEGTLNFGTIASSMRFFNFKLTNIDSADSTTYTYKFGWNGGDYPRMTNCWFSVGSVENNIRGKLFRLVKCSISSSFINFNNSDNDLCQLVLFECVIHGIRTQNSKVAYTNFRNLQLIASTTTLDKLNVGQILYFSGYTTVVSSVNCSLIQFASTQYNAVKYDIDFDKLILINQGGTIQLINYNNTLKPNVKLNINQLIGSYTTLANISADELSNPLNKNVVTINGRNIGIDSKLLITYPLVTDVNSLNSNSKFVSCTETGKIYKYVTLGSAYTVDNDNILATVDGGNTRFVNVNYEYATNEYVDNAIAEIPTSSAPDYATRVINIGASHEFQTISAVQNFINANKHLMNLELIFNTDYTYESVILNISNRNKVSIASYSRNYYININDVDELTHAGNNTLQYTSAYFNVNRVSKSYISGVKINNAFSFSDCLSLYFETIVGLLPSLFNCFNVNFTAAIDINNLPVTNSNIVTENSINIGHQFNSYGRCSYMSTSASSTLPSGSYTTPTSVSNVFTKIAQKILKVATIPNTTGALLQTVAGALPDGYITRSIIFKPTQTTTNFGALDIKINIAGSWATLGTFTYSANTTRYVAKFYQVNVATNLSRTVMQQMIEGYNNGEAIIDIRLEATNFGGNGGVIEITSEKL